MELFNYIIKLNIVFTVFIGLYHFTLRKNADFQFNRFFLLAISFFSITVPFIKIPLLRKVEVLKIPMFNSLSSIPSMPQAANNYDGLLTQELIAMAYTAVSILLMVLLAIKLYKMYSRVKALKTSALFDPSKNVFVLKDSNIPFTFLRWSFIPAAIKPKEERALIIAHERAHATGLHSLDIIIAELMKCLLFVNPLHRWYKKYVAENHEYAADAHAIQQDHAAKYTDLLIRYTLSHSQLSMASFFAKPTILNRINMMKTKEKNPRKMYVATITGMLFIAVMACDFQAEEELVVMNNNGKVEAEAVNAADSDMIFTKVEDQAVPINGIEDFYNFISQELSKNYPKEAIEQGIRGKVYVQFTIEKDGSLSNINAIKGIGAGCDQAAVNAVAAYGKWTAGKHNGVAVRSQRIVPIRFITK